MLCTRYALRLDILHSQCDMFLRNVKVFLRDVKVFLRDVKVFLRDGKKARQRELTEGFSWCLWHTFLKLFSYPLCVGDVKNLRTINSIINKMNRRRFYIFSCFYMRIKYFDINCGTTQYAASQRDIFAFSMRYVPSGRI